MSTKTTEPTLIEKQLGEILLDIERRQQAKETPRPEDYKHLPPEVYREVERLFQGLDFVEPWRSAPSTSTPGTAEATAPDPIRQAIEDLPAKAWRIIFERDIQHRRWDEIAAGLGEPVDELRALHARAVCDLIQRLRGVS